MSPTSSSHSEMSPVENLHYAIGLIAYAMAIADGKVQKEEHDKLHTIVNAQLNNNKQSFMLSDIIFELMERRPHQREATYNMGMKQIRNNSHYLSPELKQTFFRIIEEIARAYPPITIEEKALYERFNKDMEDLHGDPIYYSK